MTVPPAAHGPTVETPLGLRVLHRLVMREKLRLQVQFLEQLARISACHDVTLYGGAGLHGVYLHGRLSDDLDLLAPPGLAEDFLPILAAHGLRLEERDGLVPAYTRTGTLGTPIGIGVDVCVRSKRDGDSNRERRPFGFLAGRTVSVPILPLTEMLAEKLDCITRRARAVDFVDLWLGFHHGADTVRETFTALEARQPRLLYEPQVAIDHLESLRTDWAGPLEPLLLRVPEYAEVRRDLERWLVESIP